MPIPGVYLGKNVTKIAVNGFSGYKNIEGPLILPENISEIEAGAFEGCRSIFGEIVIPAAVCKIGFSAFHGCDGISGFSVSKTNLNFSNDADGILYNHNKTELIQAFRDIQGYVKIAEGVKTICDKAFYQCTKLKGDLAFPESLESIGANSFRGAGYDGKLIIPFGMKKIGNEAFCDNYFNSIEFKCSPPDVGENVFGDYSGNIFVGDCNMISLYANCQSLTRYSPYFYAKQIKISVVYDGEKGYGNVYVNSSSQDDYASMAKVNNAEVATVKIDMIAKKGIFYAQYTPSYTSGVKSWSGATAPNTSNKENYAVSKYINIVPDFKSDIVVTIKFT
ncbi:MAG: leucine-rich repeat domain-containing protein [Clostridia bacterium]